jgi:putative sigma-54 modulation protein
MTLVTVPVSVDDKLIVSGIHLELTEGLKQTVRDKVAKLLRHQPRIVRVRVDLEYDRMKSRDAQFVAKGRIEIGGPDLLAAAASDDAYKAIDQLVALLDRSLRKRHDARKEKRNHPHPAEIGYGLPKVA